MSDDKLKAYNLGISIQNIMLRQQNDYIMQQNQQLIALTRQLNEQLQDIRQSISAGAVHDIVRGAIDPRLAELDDLRDDAVVKLAELRAFMTEFKARTQG